MSEDTLGIEAGVVLFKEVLVVYVVFLQELESRCAAFRHIFGIQSMRTVIRPAQADLLPVEGSACLQLLLDLARQTYDLKGALLLFCKFEHTWSVSSG